MEERLRQQADWTQANLRQIVEKASLTWSFRVARGAVAVELLVAAAEVDLLVLGRISRRGIQLDLCQPLHVLYDGSETAQTAFRRGGLGPVKQQLTRSYMDE